MLHMPQPQCSLTSQDDAKDAAKQKPKAAAAGTSAAASSAEAAAGAADGDAEMADAEPSTSELTEAIQKHASQPTGPMVR